MATGAIVDSGSLVKSVYFPRAILPIATVLFNFVQFLLTLAVFLPVAVLVFRVPLGLPMVLFPIFLVLQLLFTVGVAFLVAAATAYYRDIRHIVEIALTVMFWATPIVYEFRHLPDSLKMPILLNPLSGFVLAYQALFYYREWPHLAVWLTTGLYGLGAAVAGAVVFLSLEDRFAEQV